MLSVGMVCMVAKKKDMNQVATEWDMALEVALGMVAEVEVKDLATDMDHIFLVATTRVVVMVRVEAMGLKVEALEVCLVMMEELKEVMDLKGVLGATDSGMEVMVVVVAMEKVVGMEVEVVVMKAVMGRGLILDLASVAQMDMVVDTVKR